MSEGGFPFLHTTGRRGPRLLRGKVGAGRLRIWNVFLVGGRTANQQPAGHTEDSAVTLARSVLSAGNRFAPSNNML
jgi:hypothetical protein